MADTCLIERNREELNESQRSILYFKCILYSHWNESTKRLGPQILHLWFPRQSHRPRLLLVKFWSNSTSFVSYLALFQKRFVGSQPQSAGHMSVCTHARAWVMEQGNRRVKTWRAVLLSRVLVTQLYTYLSSNYYVPGTVQHWSHWVHLKTNRWCWESGIANSWE